MRWSVLFCQYYSSYKREKNCHKQQQHFDDGTFWATVSFPHSFASNGIIWHGWSINIATISMGSHLWMKPRWGGIKSHLKAVASTMLLHTCNVCVATLILIIQFLSLSREMLLAYGSIGLVTNWHSRFRCMFNIYENHQSFYKMTNVIFSVGPSQLLHLCNNSTLTITEFGERQRHIL